MIFYKANAVKKQPLTIGFFQNTFFVKHLWATVPDDLLDLSNIGSILFSVLLASTTKIVLICDIIFIFDTVF